MVFHCLPIDQLESRLEILSGCTHVISMIRRSMAGETPEIRMRSFEEAEWMLSNPYILSDVKRFVRTALIALPKEVNFDQIDVESKTFEVINCMIVGKQKSSLVFCGGAN